MDFRHSLGSPPGWTGEHSPNASHVCFAWKTAFASLRIAVRDILTKLCLVSDRVQSYPTVKSRMIALAAIVIGWTFFGARALHENWAPAATVTAVIVGGLLALSKSFNVEARFRAPRNQAEEQLVRRLRLLNGAGAIGTVISVIWLLMGSSDDFVIGFLTPLAIFVISLALQGASALLYRPFLIKNGQLQ